MVLFLIQLEICNRSEFKLKFDIRELTLSFLSDTKSKHPISFRSENDYILNYLTAQKRYALQRMHSLKYITQL